MLILDTCAFIYLGLRDEELSTAAREAIAADDLAIADITFLEIGYLVKKDRLALSCPAAEFAHLVVEAHAIAPLALTPEIVATALALPEEVNRDPADRIIAATAIEWRSRVVTADRNLRRANGVPTLW